MKNFYAFTELNPFPDTIPHLLILKNQSTLIQWTATDSALFTTSLTSSIITQKTIPTCYLLSLQNKTFSTSYFCISLNHVT